MGAEQLGFLSVVASMRTFVLWMRASWKTYSNTLHPNQVMHPLCKLFADASRMLTRCHQTRFIECTGMALPTKSIYRPNLTCVGPMQAHANRSSGYYTSGYDRLMSLATTAVRSEFWFHAYVTCVNLRWYTTTLTKPTHLREYV
jgi:hypothetical protein